LERKIHKCIRDKRKTTNKSKGICTVLNQINNFDDSILSSGTGDKSHDISIENKSTEKSFDKTSTISEVVSSEKKSNSKDSQHEINRRNYKNLSKIFLNFKKKNRKSYLQFHIPSLLKMTRRKKTS
jgi:hypothetical protein